MVSSEVRALRFAMSKSARVCQAGVAPPESSNSSRVRANWPNAAFPPGRVSLPAREVSRFSSVERPARPSDRSSGLETTLSEVRSAVTWSSARSRVLRVDHDFALKPGEGRRQLPRQG